MMYAKSPRDQRDIAQHFRMGNGLRLFAAVAALTFAGHAPLAADEAVETESTPLEATAPEALKAEAEFDAPLSAPLAAAPPMIAGGKVTVGLEFELERLFSNSGFIPPDTMGAVGPDHIVQMINGNFSIYDKFTGSQISDMSLDQFWTNVVGLPAQPNGGRFDPRVIYDPDSERWFAVSIDRGIDIGDDEGTPTSNNFFVARTDTDDPTGDWDGFMFVADTVEDPQFHDYPTLAVDRVGLYTCTQDFGPGSGAESCYSIPKSDLLLAVPTAANMTRFEEAPPGLPPVDGSWQPALDFGPDDGRAALLGAVGGALLRTDIHGAAGPGAFLGVSTGIAGDPGHAGPPAARQPHPSDPTVTIENVAPRFVSNVFELDDSLWAVHAVAGSGANSALRWYEIDETTNTVLQTGLIDDPTRDFYDPSIAANELGNVVIGYTCSGPTLSPSTCVSIGETDGGGTTTFEPPSIIFTGLGTYYRDFCDEPNDDCGERNRWGDYSATVVDPVDSCTFWTFQEYVAQGAVGNVGPQGADGLTPRDGNGEGGLWGTRVAELTFNSCAGGDLRVTKDCKPESPLEIGGTAICTIYVDNLGPGTATDVVLTDSYLSNGTFSFGAITPAALCTATPNPQVMSGEVVCEMGNMAPDERITVKIPVTATTAQDVNDFASVTSYSPDPDLSNNADEDTISFVEPSADLLVAKDCTQDTIHAGETSICTIVVANLGESTASNVALSDHIYSGGEPFSFNVIDDGAGTCAPLSGNNVNDATIDCDLASLAKDVQWVVQIGITADEGMIIDDLAIATSDAVDPDNGNNEATGRVTVIGLANLAVSKTGAPNPVVAGENVTYTIDVSNAGPSTAVNVVVADVLPAGLSLVSISSSAGGCNAQALSCNFDSIPSLGSESMTVVAHVAPDVPDGAVLINSAVVSADSVDNDNSDNKSSDAVTVQAFADVSISKSDSPDPVIAGATLTYTLDVANAGPSTAVDVVVNDMLPPEVTFLSYNVTGAPDNCYIVLPATQHLRCELGDMAPGANVSISVDVKVDASVDPGAVLTNSATVASATTDPAPGNNGTGNVTTTVETEADLWIEKTGNFPAGNPSGTIIYRLTVRNVAGCTAETEGHCGDGGPSDARDVVVVDKLPSTSKKLVFEFATNGCTYVGGGTHEVTCDFGTIPVGEERFADIQVRAKGGLGEILNTATVSSSTSDPDAANNTHELSMIVQGGAGDTGGPGGGRGKGPKK